jgi:hypothetical protein
VRCRFATWICGSKQIDTSIACRPDHIEDISNLDEVKPDGSIVVVTGKSEPTEASNPWLADLNKVTKQ